MTSPVTQDGRFSLDRPAQYGAASGGATGLVIWLLVAYVPPFRHGVPQPVADFLPFALAWIGHVAGNWLTGYHSHSQVPASNPGQPVAAGPATPPAGPATPAAGMTGSAPTGARV